MVTGSTRMAQLLGVGVCLAVFICALLSFGLATNRALTLFAILTFMGAILIIMLLAITFALAEHLDLRSRWPGYYRKDGPTPQEEAAVRSDRRIRQRNRTATIIASVVLLLWAMVVMGVFLGSTIVPSEFVISMLQYFEQ